MTFCTGIGSGCRVSDHAANSIRVRISAAVLEQGENGVLLIAFSTEALWQLGLLTV